MVLGPAGARRFLRSGAAGRTKSCFPELRSGGSGFHGFHGPDRRHLSSKAVKRAFRLFFKSENLGFGAFSGPNQPQEGLEKAPGSGPDRVAPIFSPVDQF